MSLDSGIYKIINLANSKFYIGSSANLCKRKSKHFRDLENNKHYNNYLQRSYNKYGKDNFVFEIIEHCIKDKIRLLSLEQKYIDLLKPQYNCAPVAGSPLGLKRTKETCKKLSDAKKGVSQKKESVDKRRAKLIGQKRTDEVKLQLSLLATGRKHTEETRKKMSANNKGRKLSEEHKRRISLGNIGKKLSIQHKTIIAKSCSKAINQICLVTNCIINTFLSIREAERITKICNSNITACAKGKLKSAGNYKWEYAN